jgi:hypothetical protein
MTKEIPLTKGQAAIVDDEMFILLSRFMWYSGPSGYACRYTRVFEKPKVVFLHRVVACFMWGDIPNGYVVDHLDGDRLNDTTANIRVATMGGNAHNRQKAIERYTSAFKGVHWNKRDKKWIADITVARRRICLGSYDTAEEAARARDKAAILYHGDFARLNLENPS